jgi:hypothetical protein
MAGSTVRLSETARACLRRLARAEKTSMQTLVEKALEDYRRKRFLLGVNAAYAKLREDPESWEEVREERDAWDATLPDGLDPEETSHDAARRQSKRAAAVRDKKSRTRNLDPVSNRKPLQSREPRAKSR